MASKYLEQGLKREYFEIAVELENLNQTKLVQFGDAGTAYKTALNLSGDFQIKIAQIASILPVRRFASRPGTGVKNAERILLKYSKTKFVPLDILGAKLVASSLEQMYQIALELPKHLVVVGFKDRIIEPQESGYRDLQFFVNFENHIVEVKICHATFDEADAIEHRIYEIVRSIGVLREISETEEFVQTELTIVSQKLYSKLWLQVIEFEKE